MTAEKTITVRRPFDGGGGCVVQVYIIVHEPGLVPDKKHPPQNVDGVTEFLLALELCKPKGTTYTVVELTWDGDIWVQSGNEWLSLDRLAAPRKFAKLKRKVAEEQKRLKAA